MRTEIPNYFNGAFLKKNRVVYRQYQENILKKCKERNSLVVLPTGLGKTIIGVLLGANKLNKYPESKVLILAPTRPLVLQHKLSFQSFLEIDSEKICAFTGKISPLKRILLFKESSIIVSTPQVIKNDLERGRYDLNHVSLLIFDEAHRTRGNYAYPFISEEYINTCSDPLILGLTASPGKNYIRIQELCDNLYIENVIFKNYKDNDVKKYVFDIDTFLEFIDLPISVLKLSAVWYNLFEVFLRFFIEKGLIPPNKPYYSKLDFLGITHDLTFSLKYENGHFPELDDEEYEGSLYYNNPKIIDVIKEHSYNIESIYSYCSSCISILHGKELLETQNISLFKNYLKKLEYKTEQDVLSAKRIISSDHYKFILNELESKSIKNFLHPKINKLKTIINEEIDNYRNEKILIFTQYRDMAEELKNKLTSQYGSKLTIEKFIGQSSKIDDLGFSQDKQINIISDFKDGKINILIATSVAEEGLDIPNVDAIIFYEPVPSEIRLIQRRGRTGRYAPGRCYILATKETVDIPFYKVAVRKEATMNSIISQPEHLDLSDLRNRTPMSFKSYKKEARKPEIISNFYNNKQKERELLANRSIDEIITQLDNFSRSDEYRSFREIGITFFSDVIKFDKSKMKPQVLKIKGKKMKPKKRKVYLNKNVKALINIVKFFNTNGVLNFEEFQKLAMEEEIIERKFYIHFNQACHLGYLKKQANDVILVSDFE
jgi:Fanconi anemia group M protein